MVNRSVLCNCGIEAANHFLLESLAVCQDVNSKLVMYFTVNTAFINYLDQLSNLTESLEFPILKSKTTFEQTLNTAFINYLDQFSNLTESLEFVILKSKTTFEQTLPISLNVSTFDSTLLTASSDLKDFFHQYTHNKDIFDLQERHDNMALIY